MPASGLKSFPEARPHDHFVTALKINMLWGVPILLPHDDDAEWQAVELQIVEPPEVVELPLVKCFGVRRLALVVVRADEAVAENVRGEILVECQ
jgi:hypothetical protein